MNYKAVVNILGRILLLEAILLCCPLIVDLIYKEGNHLAYIIPAGSLAVISILIVVFLKPKDKILYAKEGFVITSLAWVLMSLVGAVPFMITKVTGSFIDAFFEIVSGFTTTGATIFNDVEVLPRSILFWRSLSHWIGGMGILVFMLAVIPNQEGGSMHILRAESTGPNVGKLVSKMRITARILYAIYIFFTVLCFIFLVAGKMPLFDSIVNAFATAGTGGFSTKNLSIGQYGSVYYEMVIAVFMLIFGINFNAFYLILIGRLKDVFKMEEVRAYLIIVIVATILIAVDIMSLYQNFGEALRYSFFQVASIISTTGFGTANFDAWPVFAKIILLLLMITGACAGATAGGFKISRVLILSKSSYTDLRKMLRPRQVIKAKLDGKPLSEEVIRNTKTYLTAYAGIIIVSILLISIEGNGGVETNISAVISCFNNIGPGFEAVGPLCNYSSYSIFSKIILSLDMLAGRLEIFPMLLLFNPNTWKK